MKKFFKGILYLLLLLSALLMGVVILCAWKPETAEEIARILYQNDDGDGTEDMTRQESVRADSGPDGSAPGTGTYGSMTDSGSEDGSGQIRADRADEKPVSYIAPEKSSITVPEEVAGKNGYQEIEGNDSEIKEAEAEELIESLSAGETGDGLSFDPLFYPYYNMLDENGQHLYRQIYANAEALIPVFSPVEPITSRKLRDVVSAVYNDHPELFWLDTVYSCKHLGNGQCVEIDLQFNRTANSLERENAAFESAAEAILAQAKGFESDYDKERYVHDTLLREVDYVRSAEMNQSAYSALVNGRTVCAGYARAFQYLMQQLGIPCYYCTGYAGEDHAWNIIKLEDDYYNVDLTWDDTGAGTYDYFNRTDADYAGTHVRQDLSVKLPPCNGEKYRNTSNSAEEASLRSSADVGFSEDEILRSLQDYYNECFGEILRRGKGTYEFSEVIEGEDLYQEWEEDYETEDYRDEYLIEAMRNVGAKSCHLSLVIEKLQQGRYLITHELELR